MKCINILGGPSTGKSTQSSKLFYEMKIAGYSVEYITEYAKDLVYAKDTYRLGDQIKILGEQHHKQWILKDQVDYVINDGPFILSSIYGADKPELPNSFFDFVLEQFNSYHNINFLLKRNESFFQQYGRIQNLEESLKIDSQIREYFKKNEIDFLEVEDISLEDIKNIL